MRLDSDLLPRILDMIDDVPLSKTTLRLRLHIGDARASALLDRLYMAGNAVPKQVGPHRYWHTVRLWKAMYGSAPRATDTRSVNLPARVEWQEPVTQVTHKDGVKITRQVAPKGRYHVDIPPGSGVISADWQAARRRTPTATGLEP